MSKSKPVAPDPVAWAKSTKRRGGGRGCSLCMNPVAMSAVKAWVPLWKAGKINVSIAQASDYLNQHAGWTGVVGTFRRCLKEHHGYMPSA